MQTDDGSTCSAEREVKKICSDHKCPTQNQNAERVDSLFGCDETTDQELELEDNDDNAIEGRRKMTQGCG